MTFSTRSRAHNYLFGKLWDHFFSRLSGERIGWNNVGTARIFFLFYLFFIFVCSVSLFFWVFVFSDFFIDFLDIFFLCFYFALAISYWTCSYFDLWVNVIARIFCPADLVSDQIMSLLFAETKHQIPDLRKWAAIWSYPGSQSPCFPASSRSHSERRVLAVFLSKVAFFTLIASGITKLFETTNKLETQSYGKTQKYTIRWCEGTKLLRADCHSTHADHRWVIVLIGCLVGTCLRGKSENFEKRDSIFFWWR